MKKAIIFLLIAGCLAMTAGHGRAAPTRDFFLAREAVPSSSPRANHLAEAAYSQRAQRMVPSEPSRKSVPKAFLFSLLLPGTGQFYAQAPGRGMLFVGTETAIVSTYVGFRLYSGWKKEDYQLFAAAHAGVDPAGKSVDYYEDISLYMSMEDYNRNQLQDFREEAELYSGSDCWEWDQQQSRQEFDSLLRASSNARDNAVIMTGLGLLNHLLSAIDAARTARSYNRRQASVQSPVQVTFDVQPVPGSSLVMIGLEKRF
jgi:TM2 domain-containing membrane protein YozV